MWFKVENYPFELFCFHQCETVINSYMSTINFMQHSHNLESYF